MKLSEPFKIKSNEPPGYYDRALRAIGQDLAELFPHQLDEIATLARTYNPDDINRLNEIGLHRRTQAGKIPDIRNLGEALRTIGRVIDADEGRLIKVFRDQRRIAFEYVDKGGATHKAEMTHAELYKLQQRFYDKRDSSDSVDPWKGHT